MKKTYLFILSLTFALISYGQEHFTVKPLSDWVEHQSYETTPDIDVDDIAEGNVMLLADYQVHVPKQESYYRFVEKITENVGIQSASAINVVFDPLYQKLVFHDIHIIREGEVIKKLNPSEFQVLRRELNAENHLYDGSLSAMTNLSDVRINDIVDFSYSIIGFNPIHNGKFSESYYLNDNVPVGKVNIILLSNRELTYKHINSDKIPEISNKNGLKQYRWHILTPDKTQYEEATPTWEITHPMVLVSEYASWKEVVDWGVKIFSTNEKLSSALQSKIDEIDTNFKTDGEKIKAVLNFAQNEIRYLGFENGIGSYKPNSPNKVFEQRYGDCKDKSLLMVKMLEKLGIEAYPMLVNSSLHDKVKDLLPSPIFFDHCVVKVIGYGDYEFYYDPTLTNQGGTFKNTHFSNYESGLVLKEGTRDFDEITSSSSNLVTTNEEYILENVGKGAAYKVETIYTDVEADRMRNYFKNTSINAIEKEYENYYSNYFFNIKSKKTPQFKDDIAKNTFTVFEEYHIDSIWGQPSEIKENHITATFIPSTLMDILYVPTKEDRNTEINVSYPVSRQHNIRLKLPEAWNINEESDLISSDVFYYDWEVDYNRPQREINIKYNLKTQKNSIKPSELLNYKQDLDKVDQSLGFMLFYPKNATGSSLKSFEFKSLIKILFGILLALVLMGIVVWVIVKYAK